MYRAILILATVILLGCKDDEVLTREFPIFKTLQPTAIDDSGTTLNLEVLNKGTSATTSFGIIVGLADPSHSLHDKYVIGTTIEEGSHSIRSNKAFVKGKKYFIRSFATYADKTVYGNMVVTQVQ